MEARPEEVLSEEEQATELQGEDTQGEGGQCMDEQLEEQKYYLDYALETRDTDTVWQLWSNAIAMALASVQTDQAASILSVVLSSQQSRKFMAHCATAS